MCPRHAHPVRRSSGVRWPGWFLPGGGAPVFPSPGLNGPTFLAIEPTVAGPLTAKVCGLAIYDRIHLFQHSIPKGLSTRHDKLSKYPRPALPRPVNRKGNVRRVPLLLPSWVRVGVVGTEVAQAVRGRHLPVHGRGRRRLRPDLRGAGQMVERRRGRALSARRLRQAVLPDSPATRLASGGGRDERRQR